MQLKHEFSSVLKQDSFSSEQELAYEVRMDGSNRQIVAEMETNDVALVGQLARARIEHREGLGAEPVSVAEQTWDAAWRIDARSRPIRRRVPAGGAAGGFMQRAMGQIGEPAPPCAAFPDEPVGIGSSWRGWVLLPLPDMRVPAEAVSVVAGVRKQGRSRLCVITTTVTAASTQGQANWMPDGWLPDMSVAGTSTGVFDVGQGIWREIAWDLTGVYGGPDFEGSMEIKSSINLSSSSALPRPEAVEWRDRIHAFDGALNELYAGSSRKAYFNFEAQAKKETDPDWQKGIETTLALMYTMDPLHLGMASAAAGSQRDGSRQFDLIRQADFAAQDEEWREAVDLYRAMADESPDHELAPQALAAAASIYAEHLEQPALAAEMRRTVLARRERQASSSTNALAVYRLATAYTDAGDPERAAETYRRFAAVPRVGLPASARVTAQYRAGRLFEAIGKPEEARTAYRTVIDMQVPGDYATRVAAEARRRLTELDASDGQED